MFFLKPILRTVIIFGVMVVAIDCAIACPNCKEAIHQTGTANAYAVSILMMLSMPFVLMTVWTALIYKLRNQAGGLVSTDQVSNFTSTDSGDPILRDGESIESNQALPHPT